MMLSQQRGESPTDRSRWRRWLTWLSAALALIVLASACAGAPSMLDPHGVRAARVADDWWFMLIPAAVIWVAVMGLLFLAVLFKRRNEGRWLLAEGHERQPRGAIILVIAGGVALPVIVLTVLAFRGSHALALQSTADPTPAFDVEVTGHQFWWEIRYPQQQLLTANELHVPVGASVRLTLNAADVIHSFWVPQLSGKTDLIPGKSNVTWLRADEPSIYRGQCAEYCGLQHAHMAFLVIAYPPDNFAAWADAQRRPATQPSDPALLEGAQIFARQGCIGCHAIRYGAGETGGKVGPDLTHVASRGTLGAGTLDNNRGNLGGWIVNSQAIKPGNLMPPMPMDGGSLQALLGYLESLK
jgi:cytochrome c oxidase subunit II